jgi:hypothetical protein
VLSVAYEMLSSKLVLSFHVLGEFRRWRPRFRNIKNILDPTVIAFS